MFKDELIKLNNKLAVYKDRLDTAQSRKEYLVNLINNNDKQLAVYDDCTAYLKDLDASLRTTIKERIEHIVTRLYQYVFQNTDRFVIEFTEKRGVANAEFYIETYKNGKTVKIDPIDETGGGIVDVVALGLRIAGLILYTPSLQKILIFDEPLKFLSNDTSGSQYKTRAAECLKQFSKEFDIQLVVITHDDEFIQNADKKFQVSLDTSGYSKVEELV